MNANELKKTALWETHNAAGGKMVDFAGWSMPIQYSDGIVTEANAVRTNAGLFDVSHMGRVEYRGAQAEQLMEWLLGADISKLKEGFAKYTLLCDEHGNIIDDCIVYKMADHFLLIINAARHDVDTAWIENQRVRFSETESVDVTASMAMIAFQGPRAIAIMDELTGGACSELKKFSAATVQLCGEDVLVARTGYTGEDGLEIMPPSSVAPQVWQLLVQKGAAPCGLGARDVLRLEAGLMLYGNDIDESTNPYEAKLGWTVKPKKAAPYIAADALNALREGERQRTLIGIKLEQGGVPRAGMELVNADSGETVGALTSGSFSPTLKVGIGMGYIQNSVANPETPLKLNVRGSLKAVTVVPLPFYKTAVN